MTNYRSLDHWRGIAVLWVVLFHGFGTTYEASLHPIAEALKILAAPGYLGVHLFFVISGYCVSAFAYRAIELNRGGGYFIRQRLSRIMPTYWAALMVTTALNLLASAFNRTTFWQNLPNTWNEWIGNLFLIQPYLGTKFYLIVYWSLVVEVGFYLIMALFVALHLRSQRIAIAAAIIFSLASLATPSDPRLLAIWHWTEFVCGALAFLAIKASASSDHRKEMTFILCILLLFAFGILLATNGRSNELWFSTAFALLLYFLRRMDDAISDARWLEPLALIGTISYSIYLVHLPFAGRVIGLASRVIAVDGIAFVAVQILYWLAAIGSGYFFYLIAEKKFESWRHGFSKA